MKPFATRYGKAIASAVFFVLTVLYAKLSGDNHLDPEEWVAVAIAAVSAVGVYLVPLAPEYPWAKSAVAALLAALQVLATVILGGLDTNEWILIVLAVLQGLGVAAAPAVSDNGVAGDALVGTWRLPRPPSPGPS
ncbi:hypothetical protein ACFY2R_27770 [Micromonospora olivasterospora]|uniref:Uncharacterized protein n=1 Tax=Micromonospora olivasterospora TaxID=1880 RepID=A0A562IFX4_MICOL|nr:hypothetical protein [Micromonospora olivasterospora]TWH69728.1 hypothetical protein JD77_04742 [Micromonospora olivasterospora]